MKIAIIVVCFLVLWTPSSTRKSQQKDEDECEPCSKANANPKGNRVLCAVKSYKDQRKKHICEDRQICNCTSGYRRSKQTKVDCVSYEYDQNTAHENSLWVESLYCRYTASGRYVRPSMFNPGNKDEDNEVD